MFVSEYRIEDARFKELLSINKIQGICATKNVVIQEKLYVQARYYERFRLPEQLAFDF